MRFERLYRDLLFVLGGILLTILLIQLGMFEALRTSLAERVALGSFISGVFFTSVFTLAPAAVALAELMDLASPITVAWWGALGGMFGDAMLFLFIRDIFAEDLREFLDDHPRFRVFSQFHFGFLKWLYPLIGAVIIASPLPDELGLAMLGLTKTKLVILLPIAFAMNFLGILALGGIAAGF
jgi:hypothetical protein